MELSEVIEEALLHNKFIKELRERSPEYPQFIIEGKGSMDRGLEIWISSMVPFGFGGKWYLRHTVEVEIFTIEEEKKDLNTLLMLKFQRSAQNTMKFGQPIYVETPFGVIKDDEIPSREEVEHG